MSWKVSYGHDDEKPTPERLEQVAHSNWKIITWKWVLYGFSSSLFLVTGIEWLWKERLIQSKTVTTDNDQSYCVTILLNLLLCFAYYFVLPCQWSDDQNDEKRKHTFEHFYASQDSSQSSTTKADPSSPKFNLILCTATVNKLNCTECDICHSRYCMQI